MADITSWLNIICLMSFTISYVVYVKDAIPSLVNIYACPNQLEFIDQPCKNVPDWISTCNNCYKGTYFWGCIFTYFILFPISVPRKVNILRYSSLSSVICSIYLSIAVFLIFFIDKNVVPDMN